MTEITPVDKDIAECIMGIAAMCQANPHEIVEALIGVALTLEQAEAIRQALPPADAMQPAEGDGDG